MPRAPPTCTAIATEQTDAIIDARTELEELDGEASGKAQALELADRGLEALGRFCFEDENGVWMFRAERVSTEPPLDPMTPLSLEWRLVHIDRAWARASIANPLLADDGEELKTSDFLSFGLDPPVLFDFDGDGEMEIFLRVRGHYHEGKSWSASRIFTVKKGAIEEYAPAKGIAIEEMRDVDGDGRPDLLGYGAFDTILSGCCSGFEHRVTGPLLVIHTRPDGTFARDDEVTRGDRATKCASHAGPIVDKNAEWSEDEIAVRIACARLGGSDGRAILKQLDDARGPKKDACDLETCTDRDEVRAALGSWAR